MHKYKSHKVVEAAPITSFTVLNDGYMITVETSVGVFEFVKVPRDFFARGEPGLRDYLVRYEPDGYLSWSPQDKFEAGYTLVCEDSNMVRYARDEMARLRDPGGEPDEMQDAIEWCVLDIVQRFADAGHSGSSGAYALAILTKVLAFEPLTPLTGADDEWVDISYPGSADDMRWQNKRCGSVFKRADGTAYHGGAIVHRDPSGACYTGSFSRKEITFPYRPEHTYVDVDEAGEPVVAPEVQQRADVLLALEAALVLLGRNEPGDSRAVSDQFVAMASAVNGTMNQEGRGIVHKILLSDPDHKLRKNAEYGRFGFCSPAPYKGKQSGG